MAKQTTGKVAKSISVVLVVLVLIGVCGLVAYFTNGFTSDFKTFYVESDGSKILDSSSGYVTTTNEGLTFDVKYTFSSTNKNVSGYSVKVVPNKEEGKDFDFTLDGEAYSFQAESDMTAGFIIEKGKDSFTIKPKGGLNEILQAVYPTYEVGEYGDIDYTDIFTLVITSYNGKANVKVNFSVLEKVNEITLDQESILF